jgi:hypothetical protein
MELLTNRLVVMAEMVTESHMAELLDNERIELERLRLYSPCLEEKMLTFKTIAGRNQIRKSEFWNLSLEKKCLADLKNKKRDNKESTNEDEQKNYDDVPKIKEITTVCDIWGLSNKNKNEGSKVNESNESSKENSAPKSNVSKFRKVARTTVLLQSLKSGRAICTCESLDARCKVHDS